MRVQTDYSEPMTCDVLVVGMGPVGKVLACLLGTLGVSTMVIDKSETIYDRPRAVAIDHEIARILQSIGLAGILGRISAPFSPSEYWGVDGQLIRRLDMLPPPYPLSWTPSMVFLQPELEAALRTRAGELVGVKTATCVELLRFTQEPDYVRAELRDGNGKHVEVTCRYLLGCDGASSAVRQAADLELEDLGFDQPWLVVDIIANPHGLAKLPAVSAQYCQPARPTTYIVGVGNHRRWEMMLRPGEDPRRMEEPETVWRLLGRWIGPDDATLWRAASYRFHALVARRWRDRRVLIAGDAAHQQPPFLGQGLCQGIRDAANIAWKLERVLRGRSSLSLLDSYQEERAAHVTTLTETIKSIGAIVSERDEVRARARDATLLVRAGGRVRSEPRQDLMPALQSGCLGGPSPARGTLFPQPMIRTEQGATRLDNITGTGFRVVLNEANIASPAVCARIHRLGASVIDIGRAGWCEIDGVLDGWFKRHHALAAIVRPDHYVFATADSPDQLESVIGDLERALA